MGIREIAGFIAGHPLTRDARMAAAMRFLRWQVVSRLSSRAIACPFVGSTRLLVRRGMTGATGNIYVGLHEFEDMGFLLHFLREDDVFADVGANIGSYTVLASGCARAVSVAFEPIPATYQALTENLALNSLEGKSFARNIGIGAETGALVFTSTLDSTNHVVAAGEEGSQNVSVAVETLDNALGEMRPALIKVDVEGFESEVLRGAVRTFSDEGLQAVIIELAGAGARYGYDDEGVHRTVLGFGFRPYRYDPLTRSLSALEQYRTGNTLYLRDEGFVRSRLRAAAKVRVLGKEF